MGAATAQEAAGPQMSERRPSAINEVATPARTSQRRSAEGAEAVPTTTPRPTPPFKSVLGSHKAALSTIQQLCEGQAAVLKGYELAARLPSGMGGGRGAASVAAYAQKMEMLCAQQRMVVCQLHDSLQDLRVDTEHAAPAVS